ncbi:MAG: glycogen/starch/alpha-glucan phosphorylase [Sphaerochaetaceae bacterium]
MTKTSNSSVQNTRFTPSAEAIEKDFAEQLKYTMDADIYHATEENRFTALALAIRDRIIHQWDESRKTQRSSSAKRVYYLSLEFLMGRAMNNNIVNLQLEAPVREAMSKLGYSYEELEEMEKDAGLGNGGLGRLAACFMDSMATLQIPAYGYGIRYNYGIFNQKIQNGYQIEQPDPWLSGYGNPWEICRPDLVLPVQFGGTVQVIREGGRDCYKWVGSEVVQGLAYDMPIIGYGAKTVNTLRLFSARAANEFDFKEFNEGDYTESVRERNQAENISQVLYPNDTGYMGKVLRLKQQYFFVACALSDIVRRFKREKQDWRRFPDFAAIQLNDTHPSIAIAELMRILVDIENLDWDTAWDITVKVMGYTNHTLMPEALEKWSVDMMGSLLPRHLQIIYEINRRFLETAITFFPMKEDAIRKVSIIEESNPKNVRMANLAIIGSHSTNGVAELHSKLLRTQMFPEFSTIYPDRFTNVTNGITQRRWLLSANPELSGLITSAIGDGWITDFSQISKLAPLSSDRLFCEKFAKTKRDCKVRASNYLLHDCGISVDPDSVFDVQVKRIHEYKRQLLNAMDILLVYLRLKNDRKYYESFPKTTFLFGGKAAPGYVNAKLSIKLICNLAQIVNNDAAVKEKLAVYFMPNYRVTMAEKIIPASDISEQLSTAGMEASGTGNMKFMVNGAMTVGTMDGANVEIAEAVGRDNIFIFGHTADEVQALRNHYDPYSFIFADEEIKNMVNLLLSGYFNVSEPHIFDPLRKAVFEEGKDRFMLLADLRMYADVHEKALKLYSDDRASWNSKSVMNIACSGKFSSDRSISEYAQRIWHVGSCPVVHRNGKDTSLEDAARK